MTPGERKLAERLEQKLDDDYLLWYDVPVGPKQSHPDFVVLNPRRGLLILETKDWKLDTIVRATRQLWEIMPGGSHKKSVMNPLSQARHCAIQVVNTLERDPQLIHTAGPRQGKLAFPWGYGVVLTRITRKQFTDAGLDNAVEPHHVICADEMPESVEAETFQQKLWHMFAHTFGGVMSLPQLDRVRWAMFPDVRVNTQSALFDDQDTQAVVPDIMHVMDLQQEQLARSLGNGHRVIHGVAGSGKTMILGYRAAYLARAEASPAKPILVLCYNEPLAVKLEAHFASKGLTDKVHTRHFHKWCRQQLVAFGQPVPNQGAGMFEAMVDNVIRAVDRGQIPSGQYQAVLIDEGHDFQPEWLKLVTQMVDPLTNNLLVLYDDAQSIYARSKSRQFSFKSLGIQAQGRTTILKINYRNTQQILRIANLIAGDLLNAEDKDDDRVPMIHPISYGRDGHTPLAIRVPTLSDEAGKIAEWLDAAHHDGHAWGEMAVICRNYAMMDSCAKALKQRGLPHKVRKGSGEFKPAIDSIKVLTMHASKGLEFPIVAIPGVGQLPTPDEDKRNEAKLFYVAATRATQELLITVSGPGEFGKRLGV
jgi:UvrD-like helicase C-terminal domain/Nuclease-related domain/AAA domain